MKLLAHLIGLTFLASIFIKLYSNCKLSLHRKIYNMSWLFAVVACIIVISVPLLLFTAIEFISYNQLSSVCRAYCNTFFSGLPSSVYNWDFKHIWYAVIGLSGYLVFSGFLLSMFVNAIHKKRESISQGEEHYNHLDSHFIIIGSGTLIVPLINKLLSKHENASPDSAKLPNIVILTADSIPELRKRLSAQLKESYMRAIVFLHGDRTNPEDLTQIGLDRCQGIYLMGDFSEKDKDDRNLEALSKINDFLDKKSTTRTNGRITCKIFLERYHTFSLFQSSIINAKMLNLTIEPICIYKQWAETVINGAKYNNIQYQPLDGKGISAQSPQYVHLIIIGMSRMGMSLVTETALRMHFPNADANHRTKITMIDINAREEMYAYTNIHAHLFKHAHYTYSQYSDAPCDIQPPEQYSTNNADSWLNTEYHFVQGNAECPSVRQLIEQASDDENAILTVAVCLPDARRALSLALSLPPSLYRKENVSILVQQEIGSGLLSLINQQTNTQYARIKPFGMINEHINIENDTDTLAPYVPLLYGLPCTPENLWNTLKGIAGPHCKQTQTQEWNDMETWKKISNRYAAESIGCKWRSLGITSKHNFDYISKVAAEQAEILGKVEHNRWCMEKFYVGYRPRTPEEQTEIDAISDPILAKDKDDYYKNQILSHNALRPWHEIADKTPEAQKKYSDYYHNSVNMGCGICYLKKFTELLK